MGSLSSCAFDHRIEVASGRSNHTAIRRVHVEGGGAHAGQPVDAFNTMLCYITNAKIATRHMLKTLAYAYVTCHTPHAIRYITLPHATCRYVMPHAGCHMPPHAITLHATLHATCHMLAMPAATCATCYVTCHMPHAITPVAATPHATATPCH
jgi:hypothetical protein